MGKDDFIHVITTQPNRYKTFHASAEQEERGDNYIINRITIPEHKSGMLIPRYANSGEACESAQHGTSRRHLGIVGTCLREVKSHGRRSQNIGT